MRRFIDHRDGVRGHPIREPHDNRTAGQTVKFFRAFRKLNFGDQHAMRGVSPRARWAGPTYPTPRGAPRRGQNLNAWASSKPFASAGFRFGDGLNKMALKLTAGSRLQSLKIVLVYL